MISFRYLQLNAMSTNRSTTWFGEFTDNRYTTPLNQFFNMSNAPCVNYNFDCNCTEPDTFAFVYPD